MTDSRWNRLWDLFHRALELAPDERGSFLDAECEGDTALREEVDHLLSLEARGTGLLQRHESLAFAETEFLQDPLIGTSIGPEWRGRIRVM